MMCPYKYSAEGPDIFTQREYLLRWEALEMALFAGTISHAQYQERLLHLESAEIRPS